MIDGGKLFMAWIYGHMENAKEKIKLVDGENISSNMEDSWQKMG